MNNQRACCPEGASFSERSLGKSLDTMQGFLSSLLVYYDSSHILNQRRRTIYKTLYPAAHGLGMIYGAETLSVSGFYATYFFITILNHNTSII